MKQSTKTGRKNKVYKNRIFEVKPSERLLFNIVSAADGPRIAAIFQGLPEPGLDRSFWNLKQCTKYTLESVFRQNDLQGCDWIIRNHSGQDIGIFHLYFIHECRGKNTCTLGYALAPLFRGRGYANEALQHFLFWLKKNGFAEIKAVTGRRNLSSIALLEKNGFKPALKIKKRKGKWVTWSLKKIISP